MRLVVRAQTTVMRAEKKPGESLDGYIEAARTGVPIESYFGVPQKEKEPVVGYVKPSYRLEQALKKCGFRKTTAASIPSYMGGRPERFKDYPGDVYVKNFAPHGVSRVLAAWVAQFPTGQDKGKWSAYYSPSPSEVESSPLLDTEDQAVDALLEMTRPECESGRDSLR
jgi:hypothetical protein